MECKIYKTEEELKIYFARGKDRIKCSCGKTFYKTSIKAHNATKYHLLMENVGVQHEKEINEILLLH